VKLSGIVMRNEQVDVIVIGAGHAGIEASLAAARLGCRTVVITTSIENIGLMPCNPSIGGPAKGQIVSEVDALGGEMGRAADATFIQMKILNRSRGPAVQCLRSQNDKHDYNVYMKNILTKADNLTIIEDMVDALIIEDEKIKGVKTQKGGIHYAKAVVITTGTFLKGKMHVGLSSSIGGRIDEPSCESLSESLYKYFRLGRLKTGTPPRLDKTSIDFSRLPPQPGDHEPLYFSFRTTPDKRYQNQIDCHLAYTNPETHKIILGGLDRSPLYTNVIKGSGPRYCPSIEDKIVRFSDKNEHHIFIEPEGRNVNSIYPQGLNTSLPQDVQESLLKSMTGLEEVKILKFGYAVEYDFVYPDQLTPSLETRKIQGLYLAGQINGTSGYEEAAGQGLVAGANAALKALDRPPLILRREDSFIGTMIDDLITKNIYEPYRMLTSRSEFRLLLRQDNAIFRLSEKGFSQGLLTLDEINFVREQEAKRQFFLKTWQKMTTPETMVKQFSLKQKIPLACLLKRPEIKIAHLIEQSIVLPEDRKIAETVLVDLKYEGYIHKMTKDIARIQKQENNPIPPNVDYASISGLKKESREKFAKYQPKTLYEAKKVAGINPADIIVLVAHLQKSSQKTR
jgi:tRNA uridine 5-carboxymethylaminomethyl modification enzyme